MKSTRLELPLAHHKTLDLLGSDEKWKVEECSSGYAYILTPILIRKLKSVVKKLNIRILVQLMYQ